VNAVDRDAQLPAEDPTPGAILRAENITKWFGATHALDDVTFEVHAGEINALLGENGAGKSTLVRIMAGVLAPDSGRISIDGEERELRNPTVAFRHGIAVVHQELALMDNMSVADNLAAGAPPLVETLVLPRVLGVIDRKRQLSAARETLEFLGVTVPLSLRVGNLSLAAKQRIEIARAASRGSRVLILDEPTSALPPSERESLYEVMHLLRQRGVAIVFITHNVREAVEVSDVVTVLRDGRVVAATTASAASIPRVIEYMTGTEESSAVEERPSGGVGEGEGATSPATGERPRLRLLGLSSAPNVRDVSFEVAAGEIVGLAGLVGSGRTELLECVFGARHRHGGEIFVDGEPRKIRSVADAIAGGIGLVPEDRQRDALFLNESVGHNIAAAARNVRRKVSSGDPEATVAHLVASLRIKTPSVKVPVRTLSGGNQQKVVLARWMMLRPRVLLADDPGRGISIGSKREVHRLLREIAAAGTAIVLVSSEFDELAELCDRVVIIDRGRSVAELASAHLTGDLILKEVLTVADREATRARGAA
jgi:ABC-type sugar transport system ATPase subunit